jgi:hypothetical protein
LDAQYEELHELGRLLGLGVFRKVKKLKVLSPFFTAQSMTAFLEGLNTEGAIASLETLEIYDRAYRTMSYGPLDEYVEEAALMFVNFLRQGALQSISNLYIEGGDFLCTKSRVFPTPCDVLEGGTPSFKGWKNLRLPGLTNAQCRRLMRALPETRVIGSRWRGQEFFD